MRVRTYRLRIRGFDFDVIVRASSRARARTICAQGFSGAGYGSTADGYRIITSCRLDTSEDERPLVVPELGPEGLCISDAAVARRAS